MKTHFSPSVAARFLLSLVAPIVIAQLLGCEQTVVKPSPTQPAPVHSTNPTNPQPRPRVLCPDGCPDDVVISLPYIVPIQQNDDAHSELHGTQNG